MKWRQLLNRWNQSEGNLKGILKSIGYDGEILYYVSYPTYFNKNNFNLDDFTKEFNIKLKDTESFVCSCGCENFKLRYNNIDGLSILRVYIKSLCSYAFIS
jgi:hypothetical protein